MLAQQLENVVYDYMESFFSGLLGIEVEGLHLIAEAYAKQGKYEMLEAYLASFYQNKLVPQTEMFLKCVEDVVMTNYEVRSGEFLPNDTAIVLQLLVILDTISYVTILVKQQTSPRSIPNHFGRNFTLMHTATLWMKSELNSTKDSGKCT